MGLLIAGLVEALIAWGIGLYLLVSTNVSHVWGGLAIVVGFVVLLLSIALGRKPRESRNANPETKAGVPDDENIDTDSTEAPEPRGLEPSDHTLVKTADDNHPEIPQDVAPMAVRGISVPAPLELMQDTVKRSYWRYRARESETRAATLAEMVLHEGKSADVSRDDRPRQLRRLCDLAILSQGFDAWANGVQPEFRLDRYRRAQSQEDIHERLTDIHRETETLEAEAGHWRDLVAEHEDPYRRSLTERVRFEKLSELAERLEELTLLQLGYQAMLEKEEH
ncbi:MAG: hypothetical protein C7B46_15645 [Sulfobacillus benefaciens]|uniref:Uncharacterized protein n=1 Tax=Sulfobacillus benefaciens TaxID=453960 RepID=A0A2T2XCA0_9FIRM|nr:MAG: hypothetical protein C7B46_15645 [Sulfobacillus benefaciens]